jgi:hypothetical protein
MIINLKLIKGWIEEVGRKEFKRDSLKKKKKKFEKNKQVTSLRSTVNFFEVILLVV